MQINTALTFNVSLCTQYQIPTLIIDLKKEKEQSTINAQGDEILGLG